MLYEIRAGRKQFSSDKPPPEDNWQFKFSVDNHYWREGRRFVIVCDNDFWAAAISGNVDKQHEEPIDQSGEMINQNIAAGFVDVVRHTGFAGIFLVATVNS